MKNIFRKYRFPILFAVLMIFVMCWSLQIGASAFAVDSDFEVTTEELNRYAAQINDRILYDEVYADLEITRVSVEGVVVLKDFDAHEPTYIAVVFQPSGYAIFDRAANQLIERSPDGACPFDVSSDKDYFYAGYTFYFYREAGKFYDLYSDTEIGDDLISEFELQSIEMKRNLVGDNIETGVVMNKAYKYDENYYDKRHLDTKYRAAYDEKNSQLKTVAESLHQILRYCTFPEASDGQFGTRNDQMAEGLRTYFALAQYTGVTVETAPNLGMKKLIRGAIDEGHPAVMTTLVNTGVYVKPDGSGTKNVTIGAHTIVAFGYTYDIFNNTDEYITHFGWYNDVDTEYFLVYLNSNFPATNAGAFRLRF